VPSTVWLVVTKTNILQNIFFRDQQKKETLEQSEGESMIHFWVKYTFKDLFLNKLHNLS